MVDIHTHILPALDDGAENVEESLQLLEQLKKQGITDVFATPHFYPQIHNTSDFKSLLKMSYNSLTDKIEDDFLPSIHLGCELLYYEGIGHSDSLSQFCLSGSNYLLLELTNDVICKKLFEDLKLLLENDIVPIIAHIERYWGAKNYRKLLKFIKEEKILTQINASSVLEKNGYKFVKRLIKKDIVTFIASDTHSLEERPPQMSEALEVLLSDFGKEYTENLVNNSSMLLSDIMGETE